MDDLEPSTIFWLWVQHRCPALCSREVLPGRWWAAEPISWPHSWLCSLLLSGPGLHFKSYKHTLEEGVPACAQLPGSGLSLSPPTVVHRPRVWAGQDCWPGQ